MCYFIFVNMSWCSIVLCITLFGGATRGAAVLGDDEQGLYSKSDNVEILTYANFQRKVFHQPNAMVVQFYNSYCGHCRAFAPKYKSVATEVVPWRNTLKLAVLDCSNEENNEICREFEIMGYPTMRYMHENYVKANGNLGEDVSKSALEENKLKPYLIQKLVSEQKSGRAIQAPSFNISSYATYSQALSDVPSNIKYTFLIFEKEKSLLGPELALEMQNYKDIIVKRVYDNCKLAEIAMIEKSPGLVAVSSTVEATNITPKNPTGPSYLRAIINFLKSKNYDFPIIAPGISEQTRKNPGPNTPEHPNADVVYYSDLENTIKTSLRTEVTRQLTLTGEPLQALIDYLDVLITSFPCRGNLKAYITGLRDTILTQTSWSGSGLYDTVKQLEETYAPVYLSKSKEYVGCRGSTSKYRGYSCGLWSLFHTLTVNAARKSGSGGPKVLRAMHGYVKNFFGCSECQEHFIAMAERNRLFDVTENDKAVLWLWISHNEVNLRLAGDVTEDPEFPKIQFPSVTRCPTCRLSRGAWHLPAVYQYLQAVYGTEDIRDAPSAASNGAGLSPNLFSNLDLGMLSFLYLLSFILLILVIKYFLTRGFYRKRIYKHGLGKV